MALGKDRAEMLNAASALSAAVTDWRKIGLECQTIKTANEEMEQKEAAAAAAVATTLKSETVTTEPVVPVIFGWM